VFIGINSAPMLNQPFPECANFHRDLL